MRLIADENVPMPLIAALRADGHDVRSVLEEMPSVDDGRVLQEAIDRSCILLTFDRDFGDMIFAQGYNPPLGVVFVRRVPRTLVDTVEAVRDVINAPSPRIDGYFVSIDRKARYHPLPEGKNNG